MTKIVIAKYNNLGKPVWNRSTGNQLVDKIMFNEVYNVQFPVFKYESETIGTIKKRKAGDFAITFSYLSDTLSFDEKTVLEFFRGGTNNYIYWFGINLDGLEFTGKFTSDKILSDFTVIEQKFECTILVKDILFDWAEFATTRDNVYHIGASAFPTFEDYVKTHHLNQLVSEPSRVILPADTLETKCSQQVRFNSDWYREIGGFEGPVFTDWSKVTRIETWEGLSRGLGFDYDLELNASLEDIYNFLTIGNPIDQFYNLVIKWKDDIYNETPIEINYSKVHREYIIPVSKKNVFIGYRHHIYPGLNYYTIINGILYSKEGVIDTDTLQQDPRSSPYFQIDTGFDQYLNYLPPGGINFTKYLRETEINGVDLGIYNCNGFSMGANFIQAGAIAYSRLFHDPNTLNFTGVQRYAIKSYQRYSSSYGLRGKEIEVYLSDVPGIKLFKPLKINDGDGDRIYEVDQIDSIDKLNNLITLKVVELPSGS